MKKFLNKKRYSGSKYDINKVVPAISEVSVEELYEAITEDSGMFYDLIKNVPNKSLTEDDHDNLGSIITSLASKALEDPKYVEYFKEFIKKIDILSLNKNLHQEYFHGLLSCRGSGGKNNPVIDFAFAMVQAGFDPGFHRSSNNQNALDIAAQQSQKIQPDREEVINYAKELRQNAEFVTITESLKDNLDTDARVIQIFLRSGKIPEFEGSKGWNAAKEIEKYLKEEDYVGLRIYVGERFYLRKYQTLKIDPDCSPVNPELLKGNEAAAKDASAKRAMAHQFGGLPYTPEDTPRDEDGNYFNQQQKPTNEQINSSAVQTNEEPSGNNVRTNPSLISRLCSFLTKGITSRS